MEKFISFIDLLGTRDLAKYDPSKYHELMFKFQQVLIERSEELDDDFNLRVFFFSDCAYLQSHNIEQLIIFVRDLRDELLLKNIFLRGAITSGTLGIDDDINTEEHKQIEKKLIELRRNKRIEDRIFYSIDISRVYGDEENLKGIGINIDANLVRKYRNIEKYVCKSFYLPDVNSYNVKEFYDLKIPIENFHNQAIERIIHSYLIANTKSKRYGRMFLSILATIIACTDFGSFVAEKKANNQIKLEGGPYILDRLLLLPTKLKQLYSSAKGLEFIYLYLLNKVYTDRRNLVGDNSSYIIAERVIILKRIITKFSNNFDAIPENVLERVNKSKFIEHYNKYHLQKWTPDDEDDLKTDK